MKRTLFFLIIISQLIFCCFFLGSCRFRHRLFSGRQTASESTTLPEPEDELGEENVIAIVLDRIPEASREDIVSLNYEYEKGYVIYEGEAVVDKISYHFEIDGQSGTVLTWEVSN